ncbi:unnamed protein product, partial [Adineta steineri]
MKRQKKVIYWHALFHAYRDRLIVGGLLKLFSDITAFSAPMILKLLLNFFADPTKPKWL